MRKAITIDKKIMRQGIMWRDIFRVLLKQWIWQDFDGTGYTFEAFFMRMGTGCGEICHNPVTSLVKYLPPGIDPLAGEFHVLAISSRNEGAGACLSKSLLHFLLHLVL